MLLHSDFDLRPYNTFQLEARSAIGAVVTSEDELRQVFATARENGMRVRVLGGGSNVILGPGFEGITALMKIQGRRVVEKSSCRAVIEAAAGEDWSEFVQWSLAAGLAGLENLSGIPGTVGAAPVQNIGAYGIELADRFESLRAYDRQNGTFLTFDPRDCGFSYRHSVFKEHPGRFVIVSVRLSLPAEWSPALSYAGLTELAGDPGLSPGMVSRTVTAMRARKLPDWRQIGNAGSFFRNPVLTTDQADNFLRNHPEAPAFSQPDGSVRVSAAWLIERAGFKGYREGGTGVSQGHALVLVNHGGATQSSILTLAGKIKAGVRSRFGIDLIEEPEYA